MQQAHRCSSIPTSHKIGKVAGQEGVMADVLHLQDIVGGQLHVAAAGQGQGGRQAEDIGQLPHVEAPKQVLSPADLQLSKEHPAGRGGLGLRILLTYRRGSARLCASIIADGTVSAWLMGHQGQQTDFDVWQRLVQRAVTGPLLGSLLAGWVSAELAVPCWLG